MRKDYEILNNEPVTTDEFYELYSFYSDFEKFITFNFGLKRCTLTHHALLVELKEFNYQITGNKRTISLSDLTNSYARYYLYNTSMVLVIDKDHICELYSVDDNFKVFFELYLVLKTDISTFNTLFDAQRILIFSLLRKAINIPKKERKSYNAYKKLESKTDTAQNINGKLKEIVYSNRSEAEMVIDSIVDIMIKYQSASSADVYDISGISDFSYTCHNFGWRDLDEVKKAKCCKTSDGYYIRWPKVESID